MVFCPTKKVKHLNSSYSAKGQWNKTSTPYLFSTYVIPKTVQSAWPALSHSHRSFFAIFDPSTTHLSRTPPNPKSPQARYDSIQRNVPSHPKILRVGGLPGIWLTDLWLPGIFTQIRSWCFRNPADQLSLVVYPMIYRIFYIPGGAGFPPSTVCI